jgi:hypothetical protein
VLALELADREARTPAGVTASRNAPAIAFEPQAAEQLAARVGAVADVAAYAGIARDPAVVARIGDLHPPAAAAAAENALEQRLALAGGAAALAARPHVRPQPLARGQVLVPRDIAGMVVGDQDGPLLERQLDRSRAHAPVGAERLLLAGAAGGERARVGGVGEEVVHRAIAGLRPADALLADGPPRQLLPLGDQLRRHLAGRAQPRPERDARSSAVQAIGLARHPV